MGSRDQSIVAPRLYAEQDGFVSTPYCYRSTNCNVPDDHPAICIAGDQTSIAVGEEKTMNGAAMSTKDERWLGQCLLGQCHITQILLNVIDVAGRERPRAVIRARVLALILFRISAEPLGKKRTVAMERLSFTLIA